MENHRSFTITKIPPIHTKIIDPENSIFFIFFGESASNTQPLQYHMQALHSKALHNYAVCRLVITMLRCHSALGQPDLALLPALEAEISLEWKPLGFFLLPFPANNEGERNNILKLKFL